MKLQMAVDSCNVEEMLDLVNKVHDLVDIIEIGTPMIILEGQKGVKKLKESYPDLIVLSDTKIMDGGALETEYALKAGADIVTVLAVAPDETIKASLKKVREYGKELLVDMINHPNFKERAIELDSWGVDYIGVHTASDVQYSDNPIDELRIAKEFVKNAKISVAGGIGPDSIDKVVKIGPDVIICGSSITSSNNPNKVIDILRKSMNS